MLLLWVFVDLWKIFGLNSELRGKPFKQFKQKVTIKRTVLNAVLKTK